VLDAAQTSQVPEQSGEYSPDVDVAQEAALIQRDLDDDGWFYSRLVQDGVTFMDQAARFGREALAEACGDALRNAVGSSVFPLRSIKEDASDIGQPVSVYQRVIDTYLAVCSPGQLDVVVTANVPNAEFDAKVQEVRAKELMEEIQFGAVDRECVIQALVTGYGVRLVMPAVGILTIVANEDVDQGTPCVWNVSVTDGDYATDPSARSPREERFRAVRLRVSKRLATRMGFITHAMADKCDRAHEGADDDLIYIWFVCVYEHTKIRFGVLCRPGQDEWLIPLTDWDGHPNGPIDVLAIRSIRTLNRQVSPLHALADIHKSMGRLSAAVVQRGILEKTILFGQDLPTDSQQEILKSRHLQLINLPQGQEPKQVQYGGLTSSQLPLMQSLNDMLNNSSANLQQSSGNKGVSDTAYEASLLQSNADRQLADMREACAKARARVLSQVVYYDFYGRQQEQGLSVSIPVTTIHGTELLGIQVAPQDREADFFDFMFDVKSNEAKSMDPAVRLDLLMKLAAQLPGIVTNYAMTGGTAAPIIRDLIEFSGMSSIGEAYPNPTMEAIMQAKTMVAAQLGQAGMDPAAGGGKGNPMAGGGGGGGGPMTERKAMMGAIAPVGASNAVA
jgi:hypothetical protein